MSECYNVHTAICHTWGKIKSQVWWNIWIFTPKVASKDDLSDNCGWNCGYIWSITMYIRGAKYKEKTANDEPFGGNCEQKK